jgi:hypothetical protein
VTAELARHLDDREPRSARLVVRKRVQRVLAGVKAAVAGLYLAVVLVGLADFVLVAAARPVEGEGFDGLHDFGLRFGGLFGPFRPCHPCVSFVEHLVWCGEVKFRAG